MAGKRVLLCRRLSHVSHGPDARAIPGRDEISRGGMGVVYAKAVEYYRRFLAYWGDGEIDRDKVAIARSKLRAS